MALEPEQRGPLSEVYRYSGLGCVFAAAVLVFMGAGWLIDRRWGLMPVFTLAGALVGAALGATSVYRRLGLGERSRDVKPR